jgi:hypothetical protein
MHSIMSVKRIISSGKRGGDDCRMRHTSRKIGVRFIRLEEDGLSRFELYNVEDESAKRANVVGELLVEAYDELLEAPGLEVFGRCGVVALVPVDERSKLGFDDAIWICAHKSSKQIFEGLLKLGEVVPGCSVGRRCRRGRGRDSVTEQGCDCRSDYSGKFRYRREKFCNFG